METTKQQNKEILDVLEDKHEIKLGHCPHCDSTDYARRNNEFQEDDVIVDCDCNNCGKTFREYFALDEVKFNDDKNEEFIYNKTLGFHEKVILLQAMELLGEGDYTKIIKMLNNKLVRED